MSATDNEQENKRESAEDIDIYSDVLSDQDGLISKLKEKVEKLLKEKELLLKSLTSLQKSYEELRKDYNDLKEQHKTVSFNSSALFKTAQAEIKRKDRLIDEIRREKDDLVFRKRSSQASPRSRRYGNPSPRRYRSPIRREKVDDRKISSQYPKKTQEHSELPKNTIETNDAVINPPKVSPEKLENPRPSNRSSDCLTNQKPTNILPEGERNDIQEQYSQKSNEDKNTVDLPCDKDLGTPKLTGNNPIKAKPPPIQGPITTYSKRIYKKIHGISPEKVNDIFLKNMELPVKTDVIRSTSNEETETLHTCKSDSITSKLQKDVQQIIKLGTSCKTSPPAKLSPEIQSSITVEAQTPSRSKNTIENIVIQCDLRDSSKKNQQNCYSLNETIENILKHQNSGRSSPQTSFAKGKNVAEPKKDNSPASRATSKLLSNINKRPTEKLTISPVTFGNLVPKVEKSTPLSSKHIDQSPTEIKSESRKRKLSENFPAENKNVSLSQKPKLETFPNAVKKSKFITSLFGESPLKSGLENNVIVLPGNNADANELKAPSPPNGFLQPGSPIFPDSPSLDSDSDEDLVIDTTAGSQINSPRVSVSEKNKLEETNDNLSTKINTTSNKPEPLLDRQDPGLDPSAVRSGNTTHSIVSEKIKLLEKQENDNGLINEHHFSKKEETTICLSQTLVESKETISEEVILEPQLVAVKNEEEQLANNEESDMNNLKDLKNSQTSVAFDKVWSPEKVSISNLSQSNNDTKTVFKNKIEDFPEIRFAPSPPQLTLVSAFKHSENSVFALTEDTLGFVSALTRMRDISPIRTPVKKSNGSLQQSQSSDLMEPKSLGDQEREMMKKKNFEFLKPLSQSLQESNGSSKSGATGNTTSNCTNSSPSNKSAINSSSKLLTVPKKETNDTTNICRDKSDNPESTRTPNDSSVDVSNIRTSQSPRNNPFRRTKPVRRITTETKVTPELKTTSNVEKVEPALMREKHEVVCERENSEQVKTPKFVCKAGKDVAYNVRSSKVVNDSEIKITSKRAEQTKPLKQDNSPGSPTNINAIENLLSLAKTISSSNSTCSKTSTSFKRSESLKMIQKPLPMNYLNVVKNAALKSEEVNQVSQSKSKPSDNIISSEGDQCKVQNKNNEFEQISHVESINKKLRISKYQNKADKEKENTIPSETSKCSEKTADKSTEKPGSTQKPLAKDNSVLLEKGKRNTYSKPYSRRFDVSHKDRRHYTRRSVSLGPEVRLRTNANLLTKHKQDLNALKLVSNGSGNIEDVGKISECKSVDKKSTSKVSEKPCDSDSTNKSYKEDHVIHNESTPSEGRKSGSLSPEKHQQRDTKCKSPEFAQNHQNKSRRSLSQSPECSIKSRSRYELSPEYKRRHSHSLKRPPSRSSDYSRRKDHRYYSPTRTYSGGRSRRSRYDDYHRRSPSPDSRRHRYDERGHHSRRSHHKSRHRGDRSRSRSSEFNHRMIDERQRHRSRNYRRRSRSGSSHSYDRGPRNTSSSTHKLDGNIVNNIADSSVKLNNANRDINLSQTEDKKSSKAKEEDDDTNLSYKEELERLKRQIQILSGKVETKEKTENPTKQDYESKENILQEKSHDTSSESSSNILVKPMNVTVLKSETIEFSQTIVTEECSSTTEMEDVVLSKINSVKENVNQCLVKNQENSPSTKPPHSDNGTSPLLHEKPKIIQVKRRAHRLGDSEVKVVSIK
ncbi:serine/arginine repetitive matrix protein 2-like [Macrosteles quadrilineatus]|uniref:serine/arginine repetitive matrix protein 2-like n=1 Tax=Macrosteles quadrilineatus TaxID=74068 RepID=UPI0023E1239F|nr:serine/arginine repetitive matrix protein 2-like [Macrosteles quadrilineatus]